MRTEHRRTHRGAMQACALFAASFVVTLLLIRQPQAMQPSGSAAVATQESGRGAGVPLSARVAPVSANDPELPDLPPAMAPSLQELLADDDQATRDEARAVVTLLDQERMSE